MNYCLKCGSNKLDTSKRTIKCLKCDHVEYLNPKAATAIFLEDSQGRLVFGVRKHEPGKGRLDVIGGFVDVGENLEQALLRELKEESALLPDDLEDLRYIGSSFDNYPWKDYTVAVTSAYFYAKLKDGTRPRAGDDIESIVSLDKSEVSVEDFAWNGMREVYKLLRI